MRRRKLFQEWEEEGTSWSKQSTSKHWLRDGMVRGDSEPEDVKRQAEVSSVQGERNIINQLSVCTEFSDEDEKDSNMEGLTI